MKHYLMIVVITYLGFNKILNRSKRGVNEILSLLGCRISCYKVFLQPNKCGLNCLKIIDTQWI